MAIAIVVVVSVVVAVMPRFGGAARQRDRHPRGAESPLAGRLNSQIELDGQVVPQPVRHGQQVDTEVGQGAQDHVARCARGAVEVQNPQWEAS